MKRFDKKFDEYYITQQMKSYNITRKQAKYNLQNMKRFDYVTYNQLMNEWFDEIHPY